VVIATHLPFIQSVEIRAVKALTIISDVSKADFQIVNLVNHLNNLSLRNEYTVLPVNYYFQLFAFNVHGYGQLSHLNDVGLDQVQASVTPNDFTQSIGVGGTIQATGAVLTAGAVWWALRAAGLLASVMSSVPAWRQVDLLAILPDDEDLPDVDEEMLANEQEVNEVIRLDNTEDRR
jgi:hypothetical protein